MKVAVTGANGFLGQETVSAALRVGMDLSLHWGPLPASMPVPAEAGTVSDICDVDKLTRIFSDVDVIVHLAGPSEVARSFEDPVDVTRVHVAGTAAVLTAAERSHVKRLLYVSSAEVYGRITAARVAEHVLPAPLSPYGAAKGAAELLVISAHRRGALTQAMILRPFSIYGPRGRRTSVVGRLVDQVRRGEPLRVFRARAVRDYVYVSDFAEIVIRSSQYTPPGLFFANVATGQGTAVGELVTKLATIAGLPIRLSETSDADRPPSADIDWLVGDPSWAANNLGWKAQIDLDSGLRRCLEGWTAAA